MIGGKLLVEVSTFRFMRGMKASCIGQTCTFLILWMCHDLSGIAGRSSPLAFAAHVLRRKPSDAVESESTAHPNGWYDGLSMFKP